MRLVLQGLYYIILNSQKYRILQIIYDIKRSKVCNNNNMYTVNRILRTIVVNFIRSYIKGWGPTRDLCSAEVLK